MQVTIAGGLANVHVKRLAYDLCKAVPLSDADAGLLYDGIKARAHSRLRTRGRTRPVCQPALCLGRSGAPAPPTAPGLCSMQNDIQSAEPEAQVLGLSFIPHLPEAQLEGMVEKGEAGALLHRRQQQRCSCCSAWLAGRAGARRRAAGGRPTPPAPPPPIAAPRRSPTRRPPPPTAGDANNLLLPLTRNPSPSVRAAAISALAWLLLAPAALEALLQSAGLANATTIWWDSIVDGALDSMADVIVAAITAANRLFSKAEAAAPTSSTVQLVHGNARRCVQRLAATLGPLLDMWRMLPNNSQVRAVPPSHPLMQRQHGSQQPAGLRSAHPVGRRGRRARRFASAAQTGPPTPPPPAARCRRCPCASCWATWRATWCRGMPTAPPRPPPWQR